MTEPETTEVETGNPPLAMDGGGWPIRLLGGRNLFALPWTGVSVIDSPAFAPSEWAKRRRAKSIAKASRQRNRR